MHQDMASTVASSRENTALWWVIWGGRELIMQLALVGVGQALALCAYSPLKGSGNAYCDGGQGVALHACLRAHIVYRLGSDDPIAHCSRWEHPWWALVRRSLR